ncbi:MAG: ATP-binding protein [bacterium]
MALIFILALPLMILVVYEVTNCELLGNRPDLLDSTSWLAWIVNNELNEKAKRLEEEVKEARQKLFQAEKLATIGQLSAGISHEIRNPLGIINTSAHYLKTKVEVPKLLEHIERIERQVGRANKIINDLLNFARPTSSQMLLCNVNEIVHDTLDLLDKKLKEQLIYLELELRQDIPAVIGDKGQIGQVFLNIILNAIESMDKEGILRIMTRVKGTDIDDQKETETVIIDFIDSGRGVQDAVIGRIFDPFFTTKEMGTGLGLSVSYGIISKHNGEIKVKNNLGKGSTFSVSLPISNEVISSFKTFSV